MPLKLRPTGLGSEIDNDRPDHTVYCGGWDVGRIYQTRSGRRQDRASSEGETSCPLSFSYPRWWKRDSLFELPLAHYAVVASSTGSPAQPVTY
jgi:hypothetical protein